MSADRFTLDIAGDHPAFAGHFPGQPILPGVVLLAEVLAGIERSRGRTLAAVRIKVAKFHAPVGPGDHLLVELAERNGVGFTVSRAGTAVATGVFTEETEDTGR